MPNPTLRFSDNAKFEKALRQLAREHRCNYEVHEWMAQKMVVDYIQEHGYYLFFYDGEWEIKTENHIQIAHGLTFQDLRNNILHPDEDNEEAEENDDDDS